MNGHCFLFAFYKYAPEKDTSVVSKFIHFATKKLTCSDKIHVEMIPVMGSTSTCTGRRDMLVVGPRAHTAYMGEPFRSHSSHESINEDFSFLYVPMSLEQTVSGNIYLERLHGTPYSNVLSLGGVMLKAYMKRSQSSHCHHHQHHNAVVGGGQTDDGAFSALGSTTIAAARVNFKPSTIFCSQADRKSVV